MEDANAFDGSGVGPRFFRGRVDLGEIGDARLRRWRLGVSDGMNVETEIDC